VILEHRGRGPKIHETAYVAPTATVCGDVTIGENSRILFGAVVVAEGGPVEIGESCIIMENAVVRGTRRDPTRIGHHVLVGPHAHLTGCTLDDCSWVSTGGCVFNGARVGRGARVALHGVVHIDATIPPDGHVPPYWIAAGDPLEVLSLASEENAERIRDYLVGVRFHPTVFGVEKGPFDEMMVDVTNRYSRALGSHMEDRFPREEPLEQRSFPEQGRKAFKVYGGDS
jgi:carbonic anhydrase/acetyltransferase-like protein (isoleucine patch superfamily)